MPADIAVDANRDGVIRFSGNNNSTDPDLAGKPADRTTEAKPFRFWCNDDFDGTGDGEEITGNQWDADSYDNKIDSKRDLEDFTRLHLYFGGLQAGIADGTFKIGLKWKNINGPQPVINVFQAVEDDGGKNYLSDDATAGTQIVGTYQT